MALPRFTVTGNVGEIDGASTAGYLDRDFPTELRVAFTTNLSPVTSLIRYESKLHKIDTVYAGIDNSGDLVHATMVAGVLTPNTDPITLVARNGIGVVDFQYKFDLQMLVAGTSDTWESLDSWWFDAALDGTTVALADVIPSAPTTRFRGPPANIVSGYFDVNEDLVLVNVDGSYTTPIELPASEVVTFVDNGDGTIQVG